ncbi:YceI family protein, partial [Candidatus Kaiserbacteria bacterium]|nr:YceI family protein [Candidatus Kaiserbacteria bacterium]
MKNILLLLVLVGAIGALYVVINNRDKGEEMSEHMDDTVVEKSDGAMAEEEGNRMVVDSGTYTVNAEQSEFTWAGKKPLIDGYINSGTIAMSEGTITVGESEASGNFVLDMNTLNVGLTAKKPGQEGTLEGHLKGERWFDVATYPTATFVITDVSPTAQTESE